jgi:hypothetical protein
MPNESVTTVFTKNDPQFLCFIFNALRYEGGCLFDIYAAMQQKISLAYDAFATIFRVRQTGEKVMGLTKSLNVVMFCAAFAFVSAMILGIM